MAVGVPAAPRLEQGSLLPENPALDFAIPQCVAVYVPTQDEEGNDMSADILSVEIERYVASESTSEIWRVSRDPINLRQPDIDLHIRPDVQMGYRVRFLLSAGNTSWSSWATITVTE